MMASKSGSTDVSREAFDVFDPDKKGYITGPGLKKVMMDLGEELNDEDIAEMLSKVDLNGDGKIEFSGEYNKKDGKDQEAIQSIATPDPGYHMGK